VEWYLSIDVMRDVIERTVQDGLMSAAGIEKSPVAVPQIHPPLLEWLGSPSAIWKKIQSGKHA
jgi:hypothetical protein